MTFSVVNEEIKVNNNNKEKFHSEIHRWIWTSSKVSFFRNPKHTSSVPQCIIPGPEVVEGSRTLKGKLAPTVSINFRNWYHESRVMDRKGIPAINFNGTITTNLSFSVIPWSFTGESPRPVPVNCCLETSNNWQRTDWLSRSGWEESLA